MQQAAQRMVPVDVPRVVLLRALAMFLPQFIGEQERDYQQRHDQKRAEYKVLHHCSSYRPIRDCIVGALRLPSVRQRTPGHLTLSCDKRTPCSSKTRATPCPASVRAHLRAPRPKNSQGAHGTNPGSPEFTGRPFMGVVFFPLRSIRRNLKPVTPKREFHDH